MEKEKLTKEEMNKLKSVFCPEQVIQIINSFTVDQIRSVINDPRVDD